MDNGGPNGTRTCTELSDMLLTIVATLVVDAFGARPLTDVTCGTIPALVYLKLLTCGRCDRLVGTTGPGESVIL